MQKSYRDGDENNSVFYFL